MLQLVACISCAFTVFGYGFAWYSHFFVKGNVPATFGHPFWSLMCEFKMFGLMLAGCRSGQNLDPSPRGSK
ncbi:hypothetical protein RHGRI_015253 [Rhododendron griersonianum]|uniref:Uncharacterized protein n=1 Tax=Rhododendron griersonianum TaxID=479676 RepID=A0AAV6KCJ3_9ERIC|nr:hypothetical protein RHGRI_015253 [Rhododendron griersonianum]